MNYTLSIHHLKEFAADFWQTVRAEKIFAFHGEMGAGKTTFIKAICRALEVDDVTSSPSFGLIHEYRTIPGDSIYHFDFYRIEKIEEVFDIGYEDGVTPVLAVPEAPVPDGARLG